MLYLIYNLGQLLAVTLPLRISYWIADSLGSIYYLLAKKDRKIVAQNAGVILNQSKDTRQIGQISRMVFVNFARYLVDFLRSPRFNLEFVEKNIKIEGKENIDSALSLGKGVLAVSAHLGSWELGAMALSILGYKLNVIAWTHKDPLINDFFLKQRRKKGVGVIPLGASIRKALLALRNNEIVAILGDIDYVDPHSGLRVKLFGRDTMMPKGPAAFSLKTGAPIVPLFMIRLKGNRFRFVFNSPIIYQRTGNEQDDLINLTQEVTKVIESHIIQHPEQWFMLTPRWQENSLRSF
jgi:KDO2-lipid IV(A) lauroyltransferase